MEKLERAQRGPHDVGGRARLLNGDALDRVPERVEARQRQPNVRKRRACARWRHLIREV